MEIPNERISKKNESCLLLTLALLHYLTSKYAKIAVFVQIAGIGDGYPSPQLGSLIANEIRRKWTLNRLIRKLCLPSRSKTLRA